jgi:hypothetical protein
MTNTFSLGVLMLVVYLQGLTWEFTAETCALVAVEVRPC